MAASAWFVGVLSWDQYARAAVLVYPFPLRLTLLAQDIAEYHNKQQQKQQRKPGAKPQCCTEMTSSGGSSSTSETDRV